MSQSGKRYQGTYLAKPTPSNTPNTATPATVAAITAGYCCCCCWCCFNLLRKSSPRLTYNWRKDYSSVVSPIESLTHDETCRIQGLPASPPRHFFFPTFKLWMTLNGHTRVFCCSSNHRLALALEGCTIRFHARQIWSSLANPLLLCLI